MTEARRKIPAPTIAEHHKASDDNYPNYDPLIYAAYYLDQDGDRIVGYVAAIDDDGWRAWVRAYGPLTPEGEEGTFDMRMSPLYVPEEGLDWDIPLIGGINTGDRCRISLVEPPRPRSVMLQSSFHREYAP